MQEYVFRWANNPKRAKMYGRICRVLARGKMNSILIEFEDGQKEITSRLSIVKKPASWAQSKFITDVERPAGRKT